VLMAFAARLSVVDRPEAIGYVFDFIKRVQIRLMSCLIDDTVRLIVESRGRFARGRRGGSRRGLHRRPGENSQREYPCHSFHTFHGTAPFHASWLTHLPSPIGATQNSSPPSQAGNCILKLGKPKLFF